MKEELIRDRLVVGIWDTRLSEQLQLNADLTLEKAKTVVRQKEAVHEHQQVLREGDNRDKRIFRSMAFELNRHMDKNSVHRRDAQYPGSPRPDNPGSHALTAEAA